jgi:hypothetical protein
MEETELDSVFLLLTGNLMQISFQIHGFKPSQATFTIKMEKAEKQTQ